jgi:endonuclease YncB( thermonuclease family)
MSTEMKGIVSGILSGDSLIIRFVGYPTQVVCLEYLVAPKFGRPDGKYQDEPFGYDSWAHLRDMCIGKRVLVTSAHQTLQTRTHPAFGKEPLPVIFTRITLFDSQQDVGLEMCKAGWVKLREPKPNTHFSNDQLQYMNELKAAQAEAESKKLGMWSGEKGFVRPFPITANVDDILARREFTCNIDQIKSTNSFSVFVLPTHENIIITLPGIRPLKNPDEKIRNVIRDQSRNKFLNKKVRVRIFQVNDFPNSSDVPSFIGCLLDERLDKAVADTIEKGFAILNRKNIDLAPNPDLYIKKQIIAQKNQAGYWAGTQFQMPAIPTTQMKGMITSVKGSNSFYLIVDGQRKIVTLNNVKVARFNTNIGCEPFGYEAREFLRTTYNKKIVTVDIEGVYEDRMYATISYKGVSINEVLCEKGFAEYDEPVCGIPSSRVEQIKKAQESAKAKKIGIWADVKPEPVKIIDYTYQKDIKEQCQYIQEQKKVKCIIEHIFSSSRFTVLIPEKMWLIRVSLNGLASLPIQDKFGHEAKLYCLDNFLQSEVEIEAVASDDHTSYIWVVMNLCDEVKTNVAVKILENGFSEIQTKHLSQEEISQDLKEAQALAKTRLMGIWGDRTRHSFDLVPGISYPVIVIAVWTPTHLVIQHKGPEMTRIEELLKDVSERITDTPLKNDCLAYRVKDHVFRVRIENVIQEEAKANVKLIDFDRDVAASFTDLYVLPQELYKIPPQGRPVKQAALKYNEKTEEDKKTDVDKIWNVVKDAALYMQLVSNDENGSSVVLLDRPSVEGAGCLGSVLLQEGMATFVDCEHPAELHTIFETLKTIEKKE